MEKVKDLTIKKIVVLSFLINVVGLDWTIVYLLTFFGSVLDKLKENQCVKDALENRTSYKSYRLLLFEEKKDF